MINVIACYFCRHKIEGKLAKKYRNKWTKIAEHSFESTNKIKFQLLGVLIC